MKITVTFEVPAKLCSEIGTIRRIESVVKLLLEHALDKALIIESSWRPRDMIFRQNCRLYRSMSNSISVERSQHANAKTTAAR